jgi:hypothetical protein
MFSQEEPYPAAKPYYRKKGREYEKRIHFAALIIPIAGEGIKNTLMMRGIVQPAMTAVPW